MHTKRGTTTRGKGLHKMKRTRINNITRKDLLERFDYVKESGELFYRIPNFGIKVGSLAGSTTEYGYRAIIINGISYKIHRLVWMLEHGSYPNLEIRHLNDNLADNRISNLILVNRKEISSQRKIQHDNVSGVKGVTWSKSHNKWHSRINTFVDGKSKRIDLGYFVDMEDAITARKTAEAEYWKEEPA